MAAEQADVMSEGISIDLTRESFTVFKELPREQSTLHARQRRVYLAYFDRGLLKRRASLCGEKQTVTHTLNFSHFNVTSPA